MTDMKKIFNGLILILFAALVSCADEFKVGDAFLEKAPSVDVIKMWCLMMLIMPVHSYGTPILHFIMDVL